MKAQENRLLESEAPLLTLEEIARQYDLPLPLVSKASDALRKRFIYKVGKRGSRLHSLAAAEAIRKRVENEQTRLVLRKTDEAAAYWRGLAVLGASAGQLSRLSRELQDLAGELKEHLKRIRKSAPTVTSYIHTLSDPTLRLVHPVAVLIKPLRKACWRASLAEAGLSGSGRSQEEAALDLREAILREYLRLRASPSFDLERWRVLDQLIQRRSRASGRAK